MTVTVLSGPERRRRWTTAEKLRIVEESLNAGTSVAEFARQRDLHPNLVHTWRWQVRKRMLTQTSGGEARFAPVAMVPAGDAMRPIASEAKGSSAVEVVLRNAMLAFVSFAPTLEEVRCVLHACVSYVFNKTLARRKKTILGELAIIIRVRHDTPHSLNRTKRSRPQTLRKRAALAPLMKP